MSARVEAMKESGMPWWLILIEGIALLILGFLFLSSPAKTSAIAVQVIGIYWLIAGIFRIVAIFIDSTAWGLNLAMGIIGILAGIFILDHPILSPVAVGFALILVLAIQGIIMGVLGLVAAFRGAGWGAGILGVISILFGLLLLGNYMEFTLSLPWAIGILSIVGGIAAIVMAFRVK